MHHLQPDGLQLVQRLGVGDALELRHRVAPRQRHRFVGRDDDLGGDVDAVVAAAGQHVEARVRRGLLLAELRVRGAGPGDLKPLLNNILRHIVGYFMIRGFLKYIPHGSRR